MDSVDINGYTALFYAIETNKPKAVELLLRRGASTTIIETSEKLTPLHLAAQQGHLECAKILVQQVYSIKLI